jgi:Bifunctional DNA primase/polymerase, N-terminal
MRQVFLQGRALHTFLVQANKKPFPGSHGYLDASTDPLEVRPGSLIAVATGAIGGIDVIDIDPRNGGDRWLHASRHRIPLTRTHETPSGGQHLIFKHSPGLRCSASRIAPGVDVKADGGYIVWWPSALCRVLCDGPVADFPMWVTGGDMGVTSKADRDGSYATPIPPSEYEINYANKALGNAFLELRECQPGGRNTKLNALAYKMGRLIARGWISRARVETMLLLAAEQCGLVDDDGLPQCRATIDSGIRAGTERPYIRRAAS